MKIGKKIGYWLFWVLAWQLAVFLFFFLRNFGLERIYPEAAAKTAGWAHNLPLLLAAGLISAIVFLLVEALAAQRRIRSLPFGWLIGFKALGFAILAYLALFTYVFFDGLLYGNAPLSAHPGTLLRAPAFPPVWVYLTVVGSLFSFLRLIDRKLGPGILFALLIGKYYRPRQEERIFLFLDMVSSTTIAEELGHIRFSRLLQDCFADLTDTVFFSRASIYQYVGDEAILEWQPEEGLSDGRCVRAFYHFMQTLRQRKAYYQSQYGRVPDFKGGIHIGRITRAEVGVIKQELAFHGDTVNTAARIRSLCSTVGAALLISETLAERLGQLEGFVFRPIGEESLRGKRQAVGIFSVEPVEA